MRYRIQKIIYTVLAIIVIFCVAVMAATAWTEKQAVTVFSTADEIDLTQIAAKSTLTADDYDLLLQQTGLGKDDIDLIWAKETNIAATLQSYQRRFFADPAYISDTIAGFSKAERIGAASDCYQIYDLQEGDVLLTKSTHTLCYRHGHSSLYLGGNEKQLLEATQIGSPVTTTTAAAWGGYPTGIQLRITSAAAKAAGMSQSELGEAVAAYAETNILGENYSLLTGIFGVGPKTEDTQCADLVYEAFLHFGVDVSTREFPVTPSSLLKSGMFEVVQVWGMDPVDPSW
jgi:hypothetical protein